MVFAFDHKGFRNIWVLNKTFVFRQVDDAIETIFLLMLQLLEMLNVNLDRNSRSLFHQIASIVDTHIPLSRKSQPGVAVEGTPNFCGFRAQEISRKLFQLLIDPIQDSLKGKKLIIVPARQLFFASFSSLVDEYDRFLTSKYSIQITPSLHTLKASMQRGDESNVGFALFIGNPTVGKISLNGKEFSPASLPGASKEVGYLANLFHATPLLERKARKQVVMQLLGQATMIHIAAHGEQTSGVWRTNQ